MSEDGTVHNEHPAAKAPLGLDDILSTADFTLGGAGAGLLLLASLAALTQFFAAPLVIAGLVLLVLGHAIALVRGSRPAGVSKWRRNQAIAAAVAAVISAAALSMPEVMPLVWVPAALSLIFQGRILDSTADRPAWRSPLVVPLLLVSGVAEGAGLLLLLAPLCLEQQPDWTAGLLLGLLAARLFVWMTYRRRIMAASPPVNVARVLETFSTPFALGGNVAPVLMMMIAAGGQAELAAAGMPAAGLAALAGGWALKVMLITRAGTT
jgi:phenylacetyl-CoA:acceptor oxidoreductase subunit 2